MTEHHSGSTSMFGIFLLTIYSLVVIPFTIYHACSVDEAPIQTWSEKSKKKTSTVPAMLKKLCTKGNMTVLALWAVWLILLWYVSATVSDMKPFDPFEILEVERGATDREIKKAYRQLSLKFHPDKNPDPAAHKYFAESITKAYQALTDDVSRQNYEKYGHPDGPQAMNIGVALPEWIFPTDKKAAPIVLLGLIGCGILLPLIAVSWYMLNANKLSGPNGIMQETLAFYYHSKFCIKESQSLVRIPETLICAMEFITLHTPGEHVQAIDDLRKSVQRSNPEIKDKPLFMKRKASVIKAHLLLLAYLEREEDTIPSVLQSDLKFVLQKAPVLLEEMLKIASALPRAPHGYGWMTPSVAVVEMMQCLSQAISVEVRKPASAKPADLAAAALLQLPNVDQEVVKKLKRRKIITIKELTESREVECFEVLRSCGLTEMEADGACTLLKALPVLSLRAEVEVEGEEDIMEQDVVKCKVRVMLTRPSHFDEGFEPPLGGKAIRACTPLFPHPKDEMWHFFLTDPATNSVLGWTKASLVEAEAFGFVHPEAAEGWAMGAIGSTTFGEAGVGSHALVTTSRDGVLNTALAVASKSATRLSTGQLGKSGRELQVAGVFDPRDAGQLVEFSFAAPAKAGKYELQLVVMSDCYVGCDRSVPVRLKVSQLTRAAIEIRELKANKKVEWDDEDEDEDLMSGDKKDDASEEEEAENDGDDYDSEESGDLETGSDDETADEADTTYEDEGANDNDGIKN